VVATAAAIKHLSIRGVYEGVEGTHIFLILFSFSVFGA
jgi:hypothetical protein